MSFGWSAGDIVSFAQLCYDIYSFCERAPTELQNLSDRLDGLGRKLTRLSYILERSGLEHWEAASALEKDLLDVKTYLEPLRSATNNVNSVSSRAKGLGKYALSQDKIRGMERNLMQREREIDDMKIDIILVCSLRNLRYGHDQIQRDVNPIATSENVNTGTRLTETLPRIAMLPSIAVDSNPTGHPSRSVSNASKALATAVSLRSRQSAALEFRGDHESLSEGSVHSFQVAQDFVTEIASLAEQQELYSGDIDHIKNLKLLNGIADTATQFRLAGSSSQGASSNSSASYQLPWISDLDPNSLERAMLDQLSSASDSASLRLWASTQYQKAASDPSQRSIADSVSLPLGLSESTQPGQTKFQADLRDEDEILPVNTASTSAPMLSEDNNTTPSERLNLQGWSKASIDNNLRTAVSCSYEIEASPGSFVVVCIPAELSRDSEEVIVAPSSLPATSSSSTTRPPRIVRHCISPQSQAIPHLLHPDIEGPTGEPNAPYTLSFTIPQWVSVEGSPQGLHQTASLKYIFEKQADRTNLCERIFGKALVMSVGSNRIYLNDREISHLSAVSLWLDALHECLSITFLRNLGTKRTIPKDEGWRVFGIWGKGKASRNPKSLALTVNLVPEISKSVLPSDALTRVSTAASKGSGLKKKLFISPTKSDTPVLLKCTIEFTHLSDRIAFAGHLPTT